MADVAVAINSVSNFYGSSTASTSAGQEVTKNETTLPIYAPEKCMNVKTYSPSSDQATNQIAVREESNSPVLATKYSSNNFSVAKDSFLSEESVLNKPVTIKDKETIASKEKKAASTEENEAVPTKKPIFKPLVDHMDFSTTDEVTEADIFGSPIDDKDLEIGGSEKVKDTGGESLLSELEAEFSKVTALPSVVKKSDLPSLKRKAEVNHTHSYL